MCVFFTRLLISLLGMELRTPPYLEGKELKKKKTRFGRHLDGTGGFWGLVRGWKG